jgi:alpha-tubulin suppressor-like RCC1 family protein
MRRWISGTYTLHPGLLREPTGCPGAAPVQFVSSSGWWWGLSSDGQPGEGTVVTIKNAPVKIGTATNWKSVAAGAATSLTTRADGTLWAWGDHRCAERGVWLSPATTLDH